MEHVLRIGEKRLTEIILDYLRGNSSKRRPKGRWENEVIVKEETRYEETKREWKDGFIEKDTGT
jgi:hypothetical protein